MQDFIQSHRSLFTIPMTLHILHNHCPFSILILHCGEGKVKELGHNSQSEQLT